MGSGQLLPLHSYYGEVAAVAAGGTSPLGGTCLRQSWPAGFLTSAQTQTRTHASPKPLATSIRHLLHLLLRRLTLFFFPEPGDHREKKNHRLGSYNRDQDHRLRPFVSPATLLLLLAIIQRCYWQPTRPPYDDTLELRFRFTILETLADNLHLCSLQLPQLPKQLARRR